MARHTIPDTIERSAAPPAASRPLAVSLVTSLRPYQWTKNLIIFAALLFGQRLLDGRALLYASAAFAIFCALSGVVYLINDIADREADRQHPVKKHRPIASGALPVRVALAAAFLLAVSALTGAFFLRPLFGVVASAYLGLLVLYSGPLKHIVIIDVLTIAVGFVLRAAGGRRGDRRADQPLAVRADDPAGAVSGAQQAPARAGAAWPRARPDTGGFWKNTARICSTR